jgi:uroporphyrinogen-III synthase
MTGLAGMRVAVLEARMSSEMANLIRKAGGEPISAPAVREERLESREAVEAFINSLAAGTFAYVIFLTGVGVKALFAEAETLGRLPELLDLLRRLPTICRGPKPVAVLKRYDVPITRVAPEPNTTHELINTVSDLDLKDQGIALLHYGERNSALTAYLKVQGAALTELTLYEWRLPEDVIPLRQLVAQLINGEVDAAMFTSQIQIRHLFQIADELGQTEAMKDALIHKIILASVGPTCNAALATYGLTPTVVPDHPKMGHLVNALTAYAEQQAKQS